MSTTESSPVGGNTLREDIARAICDIDGFTNQRHPRSSDYVRADAVLAVVAPHLDAAERRHELLRQVVAYDNANQSDLPLTLLDGIRAEIGAPR